MCGKCDEIEKKIDHCRRISTLINDQLTIDRIKNLIADLETQKKVGPHSALVYCL